MEANAILQTVEEAIRNVVNNQSLVVKPESRLIDDLGLESIDLLDISSELENSIGHELDFKEVAESVGKKAGRPADMKSMRIQDLIDYISTMN